MKLSIDFDNSKVAVSVAAAILDTVIVAAENAEFHVYKESDHPEFEHHIVVESDSGLSLGKTIVRIDAEGGEVIERKYYGHLYERMS